MWCLRTWFSGGLGNVKLTVGIDHLNGLFQPKLQFYDCYAPLKPEHFEVTKTSVGLFNALGCGEMWICSACVPWYWEVHAALEAAQRWHWCPSYQTTAMHQNGFQSELSPALEAWSLGGITITMQTRLKNILTPLWFLKLLGRKDTSGLKTRTFLFWSLKLLLTLGWKEDEEQHLTK